MGKPAEDQFNDLRQLLDSALRVPFAKHSWQSRRSRTLWCSLEGMLDSIAGPLTSIADNGQCDYVYRDQVRWPDIHTPSHLHLWLEAWLKKIRGSVHEFRPTNSHQTYDLGYMLKVVAELEKAVQLAVHLEEQRFSNVEDDGS